MWRTATGTICIGVALTTSLVGAGQATGRRVYEIWEQSPAPNGGANLFGRVDTERVQITEKAVHNEGCYRNGGLTSLAELLIDLNHGEVTDYHRSSSRPAVRLTPVVSRISRRRSWVRRCASPTTYLTTRGPNSARIEFAMCKDSEDMNVAYPQVSPKIDGKGLSFDLEYNYNSPYMQCKTGSERVTIMYGDRKWVYDVRIH